MKSNFLSKAKWYITGFILVAIILSISLSFCSWDNLSLSDKLAGNSGNYSMPYKLAQDFGIKGKIEVGDTVYFGQYYQTVKGDTLSQLEWRVVDINNDGNYVLMTEYVIANGCFYGDQYYYLDYTDRYNVPGAQSYNTSSARAWLNNSQRYDGGTNFNDNSGLRNVFNGFYNVAFSLAEKNIIIPRTISGMSGYGLIDIVTSEFPIMNYETLENEKIWLPSAWEMGFETIQDVAIADNKQDKQFSYFLNESKIAYSNPFTTSTLSNFTHIDATHLANNTDITSSISEGDIVPKVYSLRSPSPLVKWESLTITANGSINDMITCRPNGGMRPCVIVQSLK